MFAAEDLNQKNEKIKDECYKLQKTKVITKFTTWNGNVKVTVEPGDSPIRISHMNDLETMFLDEYYT